MTSVIDRTANTAGRLCNRQHRLNVCAVAIVALVLVLGNSTVSADAADPPISGVPLGGLGTGSVQVLSDGSFSHATINNNWHRPIELMPGCFGAVAVRSGGQSQVRVVGSRNSYGLPAFSALKFDPLFPQATLSAGSADFPGVDVTMRDFSPFLPGDVRNSSFPAVAFVFHLVNRTAAPVSASVALSWENTLGVGETPAGDAFQNRTGNLVEVIPDSDGYFGLRFSTPSTLGGARSDNTYDGASGNMSLTAYPVRNSAVVTTAGWNALEPRPNWWESFSHNGVVSGSVAAGVQGTIHPAGVVAVTLTLKPRETVDVPFCVSWYNPVLRSVDGADYGHYYQVGFRDSAQVARNLLSNWQGLLGLTEEWQKSILFSNMPDELKRHIINSVSSLVTSTIHVRDGRFTFLPEVTADGGTVSDTVSYLRERRHAADLLKCLFPQLSAQELVQMSTVATSTGFLPWRINDWTGRIGPVETAPEPEDLGAGLPIDLPANAAAAPKPANSKQGGPAPASSALAIGDVAEYVLQSDRLIEEANNLVFLRHILPFMRSSVEKYLADSAAQSLTDSDLIRWSGALKAAQRLADAARQHAFEWAQPVAYLGNATGGIVEVATDERFARRCAAAQIVVVEEIKRRGLSEVAPGGASAINDAGKGPNGVGLRLADMWTVLRAVEGFSLNLLTGDLALTTPIPGSWRGLSAPVFAATFTGWLEFFPTAHGGKLTLRIDRTITLTPVRSFRRRTGSSGAPQLSIGKLRIAAPPPIVGAPVTDGPREPQVHVSVGPNPIGCTVKLEEGSVLALTFATPLTLQTGDILQVEVH